VPDVAEVKIESMTSQSRVERAIRKPRSAAKLVPALLRGYLIKLYFRLTNPRVHIGPDFRAFCWLHVRGPGRVEIGRKVSVGRGFQREPAIVTHAPGATVSIGDDCFLGGVRISCADSVTIGAETLFASATLMDSDMIPPADLEVGPDWVAAHAKGISIGQACWLGINSFILKDSHMGDECVVAAGALVRAMTVSDGKLLVGNPARAFGGGS